MDDEPAGKPTLIMFAATEALRTRRTRIGALGPVALPRTVDLAVAGAFFLGAVIGVLGGLLVGGGVDAIAWGITIGGGVGVGLATYQPMKRHSLFQYLRLKRSARKGRAIYSGGRQVRAAIGVAVIGAGPAEVVYVDAGSVEVSARNYDERGALRR